MAARPEPKGVRHLRLVSPPGGHKHLTGGRYGTKVFSPLPIDPGCSTLKPVRVAWRPHACGYLGDGRHACRCTVIRRYRSKVPGPLLDRIDLHIEVPPVPGPDLLATVDGQRSAEVRARVDVARQRQLEPFRERGGVELMRQHTPTTLRRILIGVLFPVLCAGCPGERQEGRAPQERELVVVSFGGAYQEAQREAFFGPFAREYDVTIREQSWSGSGELARLKDMVESGNVVWDVVTVEAYQVLSGAEQGLYEMVDYSKLPKDELLPEAIHDYGVATSFFSTVLAYKADAYTSGMHPVGWAEFWDVAKYPGPRALRRDPVGNLEFALLAAGVPKDNLYPLDVDKAFRSLDRIRDHVAVWWDTGEQPAELLGSGEVVLASAWNGRIYNAAVAGKPVALDWEGGIVNSDWWVIPRGAKNKDIAQEFIAFASSAEAQAQLPRYIPYGPVNTKAIERIPPEILADLPTAPVNLAKQVVIDIQWWHKNQPAVLERWNGWLLE